MNEICITQLPDPYSPSNAENRAVLKIFEGFRELQKLGWKDVRSLLELSENRKWKPKYFYAVSLGQIGFPLAEHRSADALHEAWSSEPGDLAPICVLLIKEVGA